MMQGLVVILFLLACAAATIKLEEYDVDKYEHSRVRRSYSYLEPVDGFAPGSIFELFGISKKGSLRFMINFMETKNFNRNNNVFHVSVRFHSGQIVCNSQTANKNWPFGREQIVNNPIKVDTPFHIRVQGFTRYFKLYIDDKLVLIYLARLPLDLVKFVYVEGDLSLTNYMKGLQSMTVKPKTHYSEGGPLKKGKTLRMSGYSEGKQFKIELASANKTTLFSVEVRYDKEEVIFTRPLKYSYQQMKARFVIFSGERSFPIKSKTYFDLDIVNNEYALQIYYNDRTLMKFPQINAPFDEPNPETDYASIIYSGDLHMTFASFNYESETTLDETYNWF